MKFESCGTEGRKAGRVPSTLNGVNVNQAASSYVSTVRPSGSAAAIRLGSNRQCRKTTSTHRWTSIGVDTRSSGWMPDIASAPDDHPDLLGRGGRNERITPARYPRPRSSEPFQSAATRGTDGRLCEMGSPRLLVRG